MERLFSGLLQSGDVYKRQRTHFNVGKEVRDTIERLGGTMPEDLPTPEKSIKQIEREQKQIK